MKTLLISLVILAVLAGATALYLVATTPSTAAGLRYPLSAEQRALLAMVPASAESFALVPGASAVEAKMEKNPVTRDLAERFRAGGTLPRPWMIGGGDLLIWRSGKSTTYFLRLDSFRSFVARTYLAFAGDERSSQLLLEPPDEPAIPAAELDEILAFTAGLPAGDALVVQRAGGRGAFPPIPRPAVSSLTISPAAIDIDSRAPAGDEAVVAGTVPLAPRFARAAMLTAAFAAPPRIVEEMNRLIGAKASTLLQDGGAVAIYGIDAGKLLPRPHEVLVVPATPERRAELERFVADTLPHGVTEALGFRVETAEADGELLVAFDGDSIGRYRSDAFDDARLPANVWSLRVDPQQAGPVLERLASNPGLRYLAPKVHRAVRDAAGWMAHLGSASSVEAGLTRTAGGEELRVRITSK